MNETIDLNTSDLWDRAKTIYLATLQNADERNQSERYLSMITSVARVNNDLICLTSNVYAAELLSSQYASKIKSALTLAGDKDDLQVQFKFDESSKPAIVIPKTEESVSATPANCVSSFVSTMPLDDEYTFDEFVQGPSNSFALAAAQSVVASPGMSGSNPLFIYGGTGLGKTHLMQAIGNELKRKSPNLAICYLTAEEYLNEYVNYMKDSRIGDFRAKYRSVDVLLLDDVQFFQKGKTIQEEFFNTFNALQQGKKQIVMTSDVAPKNLASIEQRLTSRFEGGMLQEIESPKYETRLAILKKKAEGLDIEIPLKVLEFIADNIKSHVRAMEGALSKVKIHLAALPNVSLDNQLLSQLLSDFIQKENNLKKLSIEEIQSAVAKKYDVTIAQILSSERTQSLVTPRQLAMYIARKYSTNSLQEIAKIFDKSHATIVHGVKTIQKRLEVEEDLKNTLSQILETFNYHSSDNVI